MEEQHKTLEAKENNKQKKESRIDCIDRKCAPYRISTFKRINHSGNIFVAREKRERGAS
jgi:hypothetical protein